MITKESITRIGKGVSQILYIGRLMKGFHMLLFGEGSAKAFTFFYAGIIWFIL